MSTSLDHFRSDIFCKFGNSKNKERISVRKLGSPWLSDFKVEMPLLPSVPTKLFVRRLAMQALVSMVGGLEGDDPFLTIVGSPAGDDCLERSKSVNMICPVWWSKMSTRE